MRSPEDVQKLIRNAEMHSDPEANQAVLNDLLHQFDKTQEQESAITRPKIRRHIMKSRITKSAVAAAVVAAVALGLFEFSGSGGSSGVVWAEVARKVQASQGVIFRSRDIAPNWREDPHDYTMKHLSSTHSRLDSYRGDELVQTIFDDYNTKTIILVDYFHKSYVKGTFEKMRQSSFLTDPNSMIQRFLSCEHRELGQKIVEGVLCEGIETTDPAFDSAPPDYPTDSVMAQIWVSMETGYPVQLDTEIVRNNGEIRIGGVADQFQWDVELDESMFEPDVPDGYINITPEGW